jgi:choline monooxygenase
MLASFPDLVLMIAIDPVSIDQTMVSIYSMATAEVAQRVLRKPGKARSDSLLARGGVEDNDMSAAVQRGLLAGANTFVEFGRHESAIGHFHAVLDARLAALASA